jgi:hypothetical protein
MVCQQQAADDMKLTQPKSTLNRNGKQDSRRLDASKRKPFAFSRKAGGSISEWSAELSVRRRTGFRRVRAPRGEEEDARGARGPLQRR